MRAAPITAAVNPGFPRFFRIAGYSVNSYKFFLCVGIYVGTLATAALASSSGLPLLAFGFATAACALVGMFGARLYYLLVHAPYYLKQRSVPGLWDSTQGGWSVFGTLITFVPASFGAAAWLSIPAPVLWDHMAVGVLVGGFWVRLGCVFNGCCAGAETKSSLGVCLHDTRGVIKPRIPVQFMEMAWWLMGLIGFFILWPRMLPTGSYALAVLAWYGVARFFLEPLREHSDVVFGRVPIDQLVAALLALGAGGVLIFRGWAG